MLATADVMGYDAVTQGAEVKRTSRHHSADVSADVKSHMIPLEGREVLRVTGRTEDDGRCSFHYSCGRPHARKLGRHYLRPN